MRFTANHLTLLRILLLPLPFFLVYGGTWERMAALAAATLLGVTDYVDGVMARRQGVTSLGKLLDPIADKIFVAVIFLPLVDLRILPLWILWPILLREFLVTELRRFGSNAETPLNVTELAKVKTTVQMTGAGVILITATFPERAVPATLLAAALVLAAAAGLARRVRTGAFPRRAWIGMGFVALALAIRLAWDARTSVVIYGGVILAITLVSAAGYVRRALPPLRRAGLPGLLSLLATLSLPLVALGLLPLAPGATGLVLSIVCVEFAAQALDIWALQQGAGDLSWIKIRLLAPAALAALAAGLAWMPVEDAATLYLAFAGAGSFSYALYDFWHHRRLLRRGI
ncbi:hypothetical protein G3N55_06250 [Dissulfurirhabdus thermomarina]|uniref:CDP-diacylglycerol--glycerol-3-phosphate 3-phosphatidyltransferase n=1 Tax=Dissulfurirhabdus thermomarina TaxID=1765737 RepID=A0A6N9TQQ6_DISTH|nr:CDP-alcohol phosphatidyltransferase family protein [Dissulfurirhabdus thermomarina]NDY42443.1 hypothetical protein [Dissulfurirhabdus thermomarina]NMX23379.1 hypothetical protein [Dissulfurirhabdus thermomarina]